MRWAISDIHATVPEQSDSRIYRTCGSWPVSKDCTVLKVFNAATYDFNVVHVPCTVESLSDIGARLHQGTSGLIESSSALPWVHRFERCVTAILNCDEPVVGVIDAPNPIHIHQAIKHMQKHRDHLLEIQASDSKYIILQGSLGTSYFESSTGACHVKPSTAPWKTLQGFPWSMCVNSSPLQNSAGCLQTPLAHLWGTHETYNVNQHASYTYPTHSKVPECMISCIQYGKNIARYPPPIVSQTRGVRAVISGNIDNSITTVCELDDDEPETPEMTLLRTMMTTTDTAAIGAAYFQLLEFVGLQECQHSAIFKQAMQQVAQKHGLLNSTRLTQPALSRHASCMRPT